MNILNKEKNLRMILHNLCLIGVQCNSYSSQIEREEKTNLLRKTSRSETMSVSSEYSDSSILSDDRRRRRSSQQRSLSSSSLANLLTNLQNIEIPSAANLLTEKSDNDQNHLQLLINLARDTESTRIDKVQQLHFSIEDSIGMVELLSLFRFIKSSSKRISLAEPPLNLYLPILPILSALILLENDI